MHYRLVTLAFVAFPSIAFAANGIDVSRGADRVEFGSCVPSLAVENKSGETIGYLQVDLVIVLANGQERLAQLKSAYREGIHYPIVPSGTAVLKQHLDTEQALGVPCGEIATRKVSRTICETQNGTACASEVLVKP